MCPQAGQFLVYRSTVEIFGLPLHPLILHATVVLVPVAALGGIAIAVLKWARLRYGSLVVVAAFGAAVTTYITQLAGVAFQKQFPNPTPAMKRHFAIGGHLFWWVVGLFVATAIVMLGQRLSDRNDRRGRIALMVGGALTVGFAVVCIVQVTLIGHAGAIAAWGR
jgi:hypothetical protein